jgi:hypothetical protein
MLRIRWSIAAALFFFATLSPAMGAQLERPVAEIHTVEHYTYRDPELHQDLRIRFVTPRKISFRLRLVEDCRKTVSGIAIRHRHEYSIDADEADVLYPSLEFVYHGKATDTLYIRIAAKTGKYRQDKAYVFETGDRSECPVSEQMMRRIPVR